MTDPHDLVAVAVEAARAAGRLLLDGLDRVSTAAETKTSATDMVTELDRSSEALLARSLLGARPDDAFLGEEGTAGTGTTGVRWVVDPLDGTTNYVYGFPSWAVSIAAEVEGRVEVGVVHDPTHDDMFTAVRGAGSWRNRQPLQVAGPPDLATALVATGFSYDADIRRTRPPSWSRSCRPCATSAGPVPPPWTCAGWPWAEWTCTTNGASSPGTGRPAR